MRYLPTYLPTYYLPTTYLPTYLPTLHHQETEMHGRGRVTDYSTYLPTTSIAPDTYL